MTRAHGQRQLLSAVRRSLLLLGLAAAVGLAIVAATVTPVWSPLPRSPLPDSPSMSIGDGIVVRERRVASVGSSFDADHGRPVAVDAPKGNVSDPAPAVEPPSPVSAQPGVEVSVPDSPERGAPATGGGRRSPLPVAPTVPEPVPPPAAPTPPVEAPPAAEAPPPAPEAVVSIHPGQGNAYGKGNGNGPPGGVPPGQAGR